MITVRSEPVLRVSAVIPAFNAQRHIRRALESVLKQTRPADEIIVIDDGSTDQTARIVRSFGKTVKLIRQPNRGAGAARNAGIEAARHEWIAFLDGDDEWLPRHLELQMGLLQRNRHLVWSSGNYIRCFCHENKRLDYLIPPLEQAARELLGDKEYFESYFQTVQRHLRGCTITAVVKREVLLEAGLFRTDLPRHHDEDMWFKIAYRWPQIGYVTEPLAIYHLGVPDSITKSKNGPENLSRFIFTHLELSRQFGKDEEFKACAEVFVRYWIRQCLFDDNLHKSLVMARDLSVRFEKILPSNYKIMLRWLTLCPEFTAACGPLLRKINRLLRIQL